MLFQDKLLTPIKKYLFNVNNPWSRYNHYSSCHIYDRFGNIYSSFVNATLFKKKEDSTQNKRIRHTLLKNNFFLPLKDNIVITLPQIYSNNCPPIKFYESENPESLVEKEGFEHLKQDINDFEQKFGDLKREVEEYNEKLYSFEQERFEKLISEFFKRYGFDVVNDIKELNENTVIITYEPLEILRRFWYNNSNFNHGFKDNTLIFNAYLTVALVSEKNIEKMDKCIKNLKEYDIIKNEYKYFKDRYKKIIKDADILSKDIQNNTIERILKEEYNTKCDYCKALYKRI